MRRFPPFAASAASLIALTGACTTSTPRRADPPGAQQPILQLRLAQDDPAPGFVRMAFAGGDSAVYVAERNILADEGIERVRVERTTRGLLLGVYLSAAAAARLREATREGVGRSRVAVLFEGRLASAARIVSPVGTLGWSSMVVDLPPQAAEAAAARLAARWPQ